MNQLIPLKVILVDDEPPANEVLEALLKQNCPNVEIAEICTSTARAREAIIRHRPDVVFLDIAMPGESGIDFLMRLGEFDFEVILASAYSEYAIDAFRLSAVDYILKPLSPEPVKSAVEKAANRRHQSREIERYKLLFDLLQGHGGRMMLPGHRGSHEVVRIADIIYCKADGYSTQFFLADGRRLVSSTNLGEYKNSLKPYQFLTTHRSFLVNMLTVVSYDAADETLKLNNGASVDLSRENRREVLSWLKGGG
jgi:two-component system, LytTR family, response regulator